MLTGRKRVRRVGRPANSSKRLKWNVKGRIEVRKQFEKLKEDVANVFFYSNDVESLLLEYVLSPAVTLHWRDKKPVWCQVIGAPGSGKTAHVELLLDWDKAVFIDALKKATLISGYREEGNKNAEDPSLLPKLDGKLFLVRDFTTILQMDKQERNDIVGQLRTIYDGNMAKSFGNIGLQSYKSKFNLLLAVTNVIDSFYSVNSQLGERFISRRVQSVDRLKVTRAALGNLYGSGLSAKVKELRKNVNEFLDLVPKAKFEEIMYTKDLYNKVIYGADFVARCRSHTPREADGSSLVTTPDPELGTRVGEAMIKMISAYCMFWGIDTWNKDAWQYGGAAVIRDTLPTPVIWTLWQVYKEQIQYEKNGQKCWFTVKDIMELNRLGYRTTEKVITDMYLHLILDSEFSGETGRKKTKYRVSNETLELVHSLELFNTYHANLSEVKKASQSKERRTF